MMGSSLSRFRAAGRCALLVAACLLLAACYDDNNCCYYFTPYWRDTGVVVADFNGDGLLDVAVLQTYVVNAPPPYAGYASVYLQTAPGIFSGPVRYQVGPNPWALAAGDLSGSGHVDLVATSPSSAPGPNTGQIAILMHDPNNPGGFLAAQRMSTGGGGDAVAIGDVNNDGHADIVVADGNTSLAHAIVFLQSATSPGTYSAPISLSLGSNVGSNDVTILDLNGDGLKDIVLATTNGVAIFYQNASGGFSSAVQVAAGINPQGIAAADLEGTGRPDIVVANAGYSPFGGTGGASVMILRQTVPGSFTATSINVPDGAVALSIADLDHSGVPDIAVLSFPYYSTNPALVSIILQSAASRGNFSLGGSYGATGLGSFLATGDLNGDGYTDIAVNNPPSAMFQKPAMPGTFAAPSGL